jgi:hypothetical protein
VAGADDDGVRVLEPDLAPLESGCGVAELGVQRAGQLDVATRATTGGAPGGRDLVLDVPLVAQVAGRPRTRDGDEATLLIGGDAGHDRVHRLEVPHPVDRVEQRLRVDAPQQRPRPRVDAVRQDRLDHGDVIQLVDRTRVVGVRRFPAVLVRELELTVELAQLGGERPLLGRRRPLEGRTTEAMSRTHV